MQPAVRDALSLLDIKVAALEQRLGIVEQVVRKHAMQQDEQEKRHGILEQEVRMNSMATMPEATRRSESA